MREFTPGPCEVREPFPGKVSGPSIWAGGMLLGQVAGLAGFDYANARLWAAAPDLLAACKTALHEIDPRARDAINQLHAAIAKATAAPGLAGPQGDGG